MSSPEPGIPQPPFSPGGVPLVEPQPREGDSPVIVTHNWCGRCTWYGQAEKVVGETLVDSGDGRTFESAHPHWIDLTHGRLYAEDKVAAADPGLIPAVYVDGILAAPRAPFATSGGDYEIDYESGQPAFFVSQAGKTVTADYAYENGSRFTIAPAAGKILSLEKSEVQFSKDVDLQDTINFQPWAYNPADPPNKVPVKAATVYKCIRDYVDEADGVYPEIPPIGGATRGLSQPHIVFPFRYKTTKDLTSSFGLEIRVWLDDDKAFGGEFATATFYCTSKDEGEV